MATLTFDQIHARVAAHWQAEADRNAPAAVAVSAIDTLRDALEVCTPDERADVLALLADEILDLTGVPPLPYGGSLRLLGCSHAPSCRTVEECVQMIP